MQCIDLGLFIQRQILKNYKFDLHLQFSDTKNCNAVMIEGLVLILHGGYNWTKGIVWKFGLMSFVLSDTTLTELLYEYVAKKQWAQLSIKTGNGQSVS